MRQAIHIFRKDVRHCWPYIAAVPALTALNAWVSSTDFPDPSKLNSTSSLISLPLVVAWWLAIGAAVHGETRVGDRQFWTTRPYSWKSLVGAKLLFIAGFLSLPLLISDCIVLIASGFNPLALLAGLLCRHCWFLGFLILPFVVAALTRATRDLVLTGLVLYIVSYIAIFFMARWANEFGILHLTNPQWIGAAAPWLLPIAGFGLIVEQYALRRTVPVRVLAIALGALVPVAMASSLMRITYAPPAPWHDDPRYRTATVQLAPDPKHPNMIDVDQTNGRIGIPVRFSGWPRDKMTCQVSQVTASVHEPQPGTLLMSVSTSSPPTSIATTSDGRKMLSFPADSLRALFSQTVDLQVSIDLMVYQSRERVDIALERGWIRLPEFGNVRFLEDVHGRRLVWRAALDPGRPGWSYDLGDDQSEFVTNGQWAWSGSAPCFSHLVPNESCLFLRGKFLDPLFRSHRSSRR
jgi:hypothetical protein